MTACSFAVSAQVCWNWAARTARTAILLFILGHTLSTCKSLDMRRLGSIRRPRRAFVQRLAGWISKHSSQLEATRLLPIGYLRHQLTKCVVLAILLFYRHGRKPNQMPQRI